MLAKIKNLFIVFLLIWFLGSCVINKAKGDTATSTNILPNAGTTSSNMDNHNLDGVNSGTGNLNHNSTHNGFTITCGTQINGACGKAFNGELESSRDMKVSAGDTLLNITGTENGTSYTSTQKKLDGGIQLNSYFSVQNCEDGNSSHSCGVSTGADDSYNLHIKIKDTNGNTLAEMTTTRSTDAGYYANSRKFHDNLVWNGVGANSYEWYWEGLDGSLSTSELRGPNLLGAELLLDFPTEDYEVFSTEELEELNEALGTANLTENEIWDVISGIESVMEEKLIIGGNLETEARVELNVQATGLTLEIASTKTGAIMMESPMVQEEFSSVFEEMPIETLKEEMIAMVQEEMPFMAMMEELAPPPPPMEMMEEMEEEEPPMMTMRPGPMMEEAPAPTEEGPPTSRGPMPMMIEEEPQEEKPQQMASRPMETAPAKKEMTNAPREKSRKPEPTATRQEETQEEESREEPKETFTEEAPKENAPKQTAKTEKKPSSQSTIKSTRTKTARNKEQKAIQEGKAKVANIARIMDKVDQNVKDKSKNLQLKNLIKLDAMTSDQVSLNLYNVPFYKPKDIYLDQLNMQDNRQIYVNVNLATYIENDKITVNKKKLNEIQLKKREILLELERLRNG
jgi:hypothetical protein